MEFIFQILAEFVFQFIVEGCFDVLFGKTLKTERPLLRFFIFLFLGATLGGLSLLVFPSHLVTDRSLRFVTVLTVPLIIGFIMARIGRARAKRGSQPNDLEFFFSGWGFAFAFGATRVLFAK